MPITKKTSLEDQIKDLVQRYAPNMTSFNTYNEIDNQAILNDNDSILIQHIDEINKVPLSKLYDDIKTDVINDVSTNANTYTDDRKIELQDVILSSNLDNSNYTDFRKIQLQNVIISSNLDNSNFTDLRKIQLQNVILSSNLDSSNYIDTEISTLQTSTKTITDKITKLILPETITDIDANPDYRLEIGYKKSKEEYNIYFDSYIMPYFQPLTGGNIVPTNNLNDIIVNNEITDNFLKIVNRGEYSRSVQGAIYYNLIDQNTNTAFSMSIILDDMNTDMNKQIFNLNGYKLFYNKTGNVKKLIYKTPITKTIFNTISYFKIDGQNFTTGYGVKVLDKNDWDITDTRITQTETLIGKLDTLVYTFDKPVYLRTVSWDLLLLENVSPYPSIISALFFTNTSGQTDTILSDGTIITTGSGNLTIEFNVLRYNITEIQLRFNVNNASYWGTNNESLLRIKNVSVYVDETFVEILHETEDREVILTQNQAIPNGDYAKENQFFFIHKFQNPQLLITYGNITTSLSAMPRDGWSLETYNTFSIGDEGLTFNNFGYRKNNPWNTDDIIKIRTLTKQERIIKINDTSLLNNVYISNKLYLPSHELSVTNTGTLQLSRRSDNTLSTIATTTDLSDVVRTGNINNSSLEIDENGDLNVKSSIQYNDNKVQNYLTNNNYAKKNDIPAPPNLAPYQLIENAFSGNYNDLNGKPTLFDGNYNSLINLPNLTVYSKFSGSYADLTGLPTLFDGNYSSLINKPTLFDGNYNSLTNLPDLNSIAYTDTKVRSVLSNSAGTNVSWNTGTNKFDVLNVVKNGDTFFSLGNGTAGVPTIALRGNNSAAISSQIIFADSYTGTAPYYQGMAMYFSSAYNTFHISGDNNNDAILDTPIHFTIRRSDGAVGIGSTAPTKKLDVLGDVNVTGTYYINGVAIKNFSGVYADLTGKPTLFDGNYNSLINIPNLSLYQLIENAYTDTNTQTFLTNNGYAKITDIPAPPNLTPYQLIADAFSGNYDDLTGKPTLFDGNYNSLINKPNLSIYSTFSGNYNDLTGKPTLFDGNYNSLINLPTLFNRDYNNLINLPTLFNGDYNSLINKPVLFNKDYNELQNLPNLSVYSTFSGSYNDLANLPNLSIYSTFTGNYNDLNGKPTLFDGNYNSLYNLPDLNSISYTDTKVRNVLSNSAGTNLVWNTTTNKFDASATSKWTTNGTDIYYNTGGVAIGSTAATPFKFLVNGSSYFSQPLALNSTNNSSLYWNGANNTFLGRAYIANGYMTGTAAGDLILSSDEKIYIKSGGSTAVPAIKIDKNNNVIIGTLSENPAYKLQISGNVNVSGTYYINGTAINNFDGNYSSLIGKPNLSIYSTFSGNYNDLSGIPDLSNYVLNSSLTTTNDNVSALNTRVTTLETAPPAETARLTRGMSVQTKHLTYTKMDVKNNTGWDAINDSLTDGFVIAITPTNSASKILVNMIVQIGLNSATDSRWWGIKLYRKIGTGAWTEVTGANGTETGDGASTAGTPVWISNNFGAGAEYKQLITSASGTYLDAPNTTEIVYYTAFWNARIGDGASNPSGNMYINRSSWQEDAYRPAPSSSWTATEIWDLGTVYSAGANTTDLSTYNGAVKLTTLTFADNSVLNTATEIIKFSNLNTTSYSPSTTQTECDVILYKQTASPNVNIVRGKFWVDKPLKFTPPVASGSIFTPDTPSYISLDINTNTLEIDANGKLNVIGGGSTDLSAYNAPIGCTTLSAISDQAYIATFKHTNLTQGIGIGYDRLVALGNNASQSISLVSRGTGNIIFTTNGSDKFFIGGSDGAMRMVNNTWHRSLNDGLERVYYGLNGTTFYRGHTFYTHTWRSGTDATIAQLYSNGGMWIAGGLGQYSDSRIKKNIEDIDDNEALNKLLAIQPKTYNYINEKLLGTQRVYGFIAQQVKEVIPQAVKLMKEYEPNIYKICDCEGDKIYVSIPNNILIGTEIKLLDVDDNHIECKILEIADDYIKVDKTFSVNSIFVYGYKIDDLHMLTKEYIFTLNVCATQILSRKIDEQKVIIDTQQEKINELENKLNTLMGHLGL